MQQDYPDQDERQPQGDLAYPLPILENRKPPTPFQQFADRVGLVPFIISLLLVILFLLIATFFLFKMIYPPEEKVDFLPGGGGGGGGNNGETVNKIQKQMQQKMVSSTSVSKRISSTSTSASFTLPDSSAEMVDAGIPMEFGSADAGSGGGSGGGQGTGVGKGIGSGSGPGKGVGAGQLGIGALIPTIMKGRCTDQERLRMVKEAGGTEQIEASVKKSLAWLKGQQNSDGSWGDTYVPSMTGLVLLCYLGHCETTTSEQYGENITKAISYLINLAQKNEGYMTSNRGANQLPYEHAICTYALAEALTFSRTLQFPIPMLEETVKQAGTIIASSQNGEGGWDYKYATGDRCDLSVAGWQMQALKAIKATKLEIPGFEDVIRKSLRCISSTNYSKDGLFCYVKGTARASMTSVGTLCLQQWEKSHTSEAREGVKFIMDGLELRDAKDSKRERLLKKYGGEEAKARSPLLFDLRYNDPDADPYVWYYTAQVMRNADGKEWEAMNQAIIAEYLPNVQGDGSFKMINSKFHGPSGNSRQIYVQALNTLVLEVYYRFLPATSAGKARGIDGALDSLR